MDDAAPRELSASGPFPAATAPQSASEAEHEAEAMVVPPHLAKAGQPELAQAPPPPEQGRGDEAGALVGKRVYVVDANSLIFQVFHAIPAMTSPRGLPVNAVYGYTRDMLYLLEMKQPDYLFCAFDLAAPTFRHELVDDYKGKRSEMPPDLSPQFDEIRRVLVALGIPILEQPGYEADDLLATVADQVERGGGTCVLVTGDKDCRQLLSDAVSIYNIRKDATYDAAALAADWGVRPDQVVDFQSLVGDSVDNIVGVPGVGPKGACELLSTYGTLDAILAGAEQMKAGKRRENLIAFRERAQTVRTLVRLARDVPTEIDWSATAGCRINAEALGVLFAEWGFRGFADRARRLATKHGPRAPGPTESAKVLPSRGTENGVPGADAECVAPSGPARVAWNVEYRLVDSPDAFAEFLAELRRQTRISFDTETTSVYPTWAELVGLSFCWDDDVAYYLPVRAPEGEARLDGAQVIREIRGVLEDAHVEKVGQNLKYDLIVLRGAGVRVRGLWFDTMIASYLLDSGERNHNLDHLARRYLDHTNIAIEELIGRGKQQKRMDEVSTRLVADYAGEDALVAWRLMAPLAERLKSEGLEQLFRELELPLVDVLVELETNGIRVDRERLAELSAAFGAEMTRREQTIYELAGHPFNLNSPKQLQQVLFEEHKLPVLKRTQTGPSTDADVLEELAALHPLPAEMTEYRQFSKLKGTYVDALPELVNPRTGRVHASFNQVVAATGRLSCSDPNLQNIPIRTEAGRQIRSAFLPGEPGWVLLGADYSQIELRVLAHYSGDATLCEAFARDEDIHARVAAQVNGVPLASVTPAMRRIAKTVNFGVIYGQSPFGLAKQLRIGQDEAAAFIDAYFQQYPGVDAFMTRVLVECRERGFVETILGRRRAIVGIRTELGRQRNMSERTAINSVIQGSAADLMKLAMLAVQARLEKEKLRSKMLLQIHDELVFEAPLEERDVLAALVVEEMTGVLALTVPLKVDVKSGRRWSEVEAW